MSDIVERLRVDMHAYGICQEAAAEIERLRKRVDRWKAVKEIAESVGNELVRKERERAEAAEARLAEAVEVVRSLMEHHDEDIGMDDQDDDDCVGWYANGDQMSLTFGVLRRARAFLAKMDEKP